MDHLLNPGHQGPGNDDLEGRTLSVDIPGGAIFVRLIEMGSFDESVIREEKERGARREVSEARCKFELQVLKNVPEDMLDGLFCR